MNKVECLLTLIELTFFMYVSHSLMMSNLSNDHCFHISALFSVKAMISAASVFQYEILDVKKQRTRNISISLFKLILCDLVILFLLGCCHQALLLRPEDAATAYVNIKVLYALAWMNSISGLDRLSNIHIVMRTQILTVDG